MNARTDALLLGIVAGAAVALAACAVLQALLLTAPKTEALESRTARLERYADVLLPRVREHDEQLRALAATHDTARLPW
jgi:uncharacterized protein YceH (UPF0502 family)